MSNGRQTAQLLRDPAPLGKLVELTEVQRKNIAEITRQPVDTELERVVYESHQVCV